VLISRAVISLLAGLLVSPLAGNLIRPLEYTNGSTEDVDLITLYFSRLVLGVQLVLAGVQLPSRYLALHWKPLAILLGPIMVAMWMATSLLVWALVPGISFLHALAVGACVTPTDPVLSNVIVKGRFADKNVPKELQRIIIAESGANDGLGYPFLFFALYLIKYLGAGGEEGGGGSSGAGTAMGLWFGETWGYTIILSVVYGTAVGWIAKELVCIPATPLCALVRRVSMTDISMQATLGRRAEICRSREFSRIRHLPCSLYCGNVRDDWERRCACVLHCWECFYVG